MNTISKTKQFFVGLTIAIAGFAVDAEVEAKPITRKNKALLESRSASKGKTSIAYIEQALKDAADRVGVPYELLTAICRVESNLDPQAIRYDDGGSGNHAYGMCQVLGATAAKYVRVDKTCNQDFRTSGKPRSHASCNLFGPRVNAYVAASYLKANMDRHGGNLLKATLSYNAGSVRLCGPSGWLKDKMGRRIYRCLPGDLLNRRYLDRVFMYAADLRLHSANLASSEKVWIDRYFPTFFASND